MGFLMKNAYKSALKTHSKNYDVAYTQFLVKHFYTNIQYILKLWNQYNIHWIE